MKNIKLIFLAILLNTGLSQAQTQLPSFFSNDMVLQQDEDVNIWGKDEPGALINVEGSWGKSASVETDLEGNWKVALRTPLASDDAYTVTIYGNDTLELGNVLIGEVWLCSGQSNMEMPLKGFNNQPINGSNEEILNSANDRIRLFDTQRAYSLQPRDDVEGKWLIAEPTTAGDFSAVAYFFAKRLENILDVPIGLIETSWGGSSAEAWTDNATLKTFKSIELPEEIPQKGINKTPTLLYNGMLHPFLGYRIAGAIWYQGEANRNHPEQYKELFPAMVQSWRKKWGQGSFPFYFVQIAPFGYKDCNSAFLREAQLHTMQNLENTGMAVTMDIGDCDFIHPREKKLVGERLVYWALSSTYGIGGIACSGPVYQSMDATGNGRIRLNFDFANNGLSSFGRELTGFQVAGPDKVFVPAMARIDGGKSVTVWNQEVADPMAVRYAFDNCTPGSLYNVEGLPASSFRTDDWKE